VPAVAIGVHAAVRAVASLPEPLDERVEFSLVREAVERFGQIVFDHVLVRVAVTPEHAPRHGRLRFVEPHGPRRGVEPCLARLGHSHSDSRSQ
jgi:hypothetical protein